MQNSHRLGIVSALSMGGMIALESFSLIIILKERKKKGHLAAPEELFFI